MIKHQMMEHGSRAPKFTMRVIKNFKTSLARQIAEAVRIFRRGGGSHPNSKGEYSRCYIPRLMGEEVEQSKEKEQREEEERELFRQQDNHW